MACVVGAGVGRVVGAGVGRVVGCWAGRGVAVGTGGTVDTGCAGWTVGRVDGVAGGAAGDLGLGVTGTDDGAIATLVGEGWTDDDGAGPGLAEACGSGGTEEPPGRALDIAAGEGLVRTAMAGLWPGTPEAAARRWSSTPPRPNATETSTRFTAPSARTRRTR